MLFCSKFVIILNMTTLEDSPTYGRLAQIMIVDDHPNTAEMLARVIRTLDLPLNVRTATSARDAIAQIGNTALDILITDFMMPGANGLNLIEELIAQNCEPRHTILVTAYDTPGLAIAARRYKVQEYLVKPVAPEKLRDLVAGLLRNIQNESQLTRQSNRRFRILIADDYSDNVRLLSARLQHEGYEYLVARNGNEALERLRAEKPDLLLLDINMPQKDGFEVLAEMRADEQIAHIPVIVITAARINSQDVRKGISLGADDYITKPFDWHELAARIRNKLRIKQHEDTLRDENRQLTLLLEISKALNSAADFEELVSVLLAHVVVLTDAENAALLLFGDENIQAPQVFAPQTAGALGNVQTWQRCLSGNSMVHLFEQQQSALLTLQHSDCIELFDTHWQEMFVFPLTLRQQMLGVLVLVHSQTNHFTTKHAHLVESILPHAVLSIQNLQRYERLQNLNGR